MNITQAIELKIAANLKDLRTLKSKSIHKDKLRGICKDHGCTVQQLDQLIEQALEDPSTLCSKIILKALLPSPKKQGVHEKFQQDKIDEQIKLVNHKLQKSSTIFSVNWSNQTKYIKNGKITEIKQNKTKSFDGSLNRNSRIIGYFVMKFTDDTGGGQDHNLMEIENTLAEISNYSLSDIPTIFFILDGTYWHTKLNKYDNKTHFEYLENKYKNKKIKFYSLETISNFGRDIFYL